MGIDAATYYLKSAWPVNAFLNGFTLEVQPPTVASTEGSNAVAIRVEDGSKSYELVFTATEVRLNGGDLYTHGNLRVRLVIAVGGLIADLWISDEQVESGTSGDSTAASGLRFGDLADADDSDAVWSSIAYAFTPQDVKLAETVYVRVSHSSGNDFGAESAAHSFTFASAGGAGGTVGTGNLVARDRYNLDEL